MPMLNCEQVVGSHRTRPLIAWMTSTFQEMLPRALELGLIADEVAVEGLEAQMQAAIAAARARIVGPEQYCAWSRM